jgi:ureidoacrylate peracid hydrolase
VHRVDFPPKELAETVMRRRGRLGVFSEIDARRTALIVIDMQNAFVAEGAPMEVPTARAIVPNINRLAGELRGAGGEVIWIVTTLAPEGPNAWPIYYAHFFRPERRAVHQAALAEGTSFHALYPALSVDRQDRILSKNRFSAFIQGACDLEGELRARHRDTILIGGTLTNTCCESTARDAMMRDFKVLMVSDANAAPSDQDHLVGLWTVYQSFGDVRRTDEVCAMIRGERLD